MTDSVEQKLPQEKSTMEGTGEAVNLELQELFHAPITLFRMFEPMYRRVAFLSSALDAEMALVSLQSAVELHQRWDAACFLCIIYAIHKPDMKAARDLASFLLPWIMVLIGQAESDHPLRAVLTLVPEDRPYVHYILGLMILKDLSLGKNAKPSPETFHQGVHHLLEFSAQPYEYAPAFLQAAIALESSPMGDVATAICLYARAVRAEALPIACYRLATFFFEKRLRDGYKSVILERVPDEAAALRLLKIAASKGHTGAQVEYVARSLEHIDISTPLIPFTMPSGDSVEDIILRLTSASSEAELEVVAKKMADDVETLQECVVYLSGHLSLAATMPHLVPLDELDILRDTPLLLYQFAQCQEKLAIYHFFDCEDSQETQKLASEYAMTAMLAYHRCLLVQPVDIHLPSALRLYDFYVHEGRGLLVHLDGQKKIIPIDCQIGEDLERYDRDIAHGGLGFTTSKVGFDNKHKVDIQVDWQVKRWTFLQRLLPCATASTIPGAAEVHYHLGLCYESGVVSEHGQILVPSNLQSAINSWKKAAKLDFALAMYKLVPYLAEGIPTPSLDGTGECILKKNIMQANQYLFRAAEQNIGDAQHAMGVKEEDEALRSASKQMQRTTSGITADSAVSVNGNDSNSHSSNDLRASLQRASSSSSLINMWSMIHNPHFVLAKQWYVRGVQSSGHAHCKAALLRVLKLEQQAAEQHAQQQESLSRIRLAESNNSSKHSLSTEVVSPEVPDSTNVSTEVNTNTQDAFETTTPTLSSSPIIHTPVIASDSASVSSSVSPATASVASATRTSEQNGGVHDHHNRSGNNLIVVPVQVQQPAQHHQQQQYQHPPMQQMYYPVPPNTSMAMPNYYHQPQAANFMQHYYPVPSQVQYNYSSGVAMQGIQHPQHAFVQGQPAPMPVAQGFAFQSHQQHHPPSTR